MGTYISCKECKVDLPSQHPGDLAENLLKWKKDGCPQCGTHDQYYLGVKTNP